MNSQNFILNAGTMLFAIMAWMLIVIIYKCLKLLGRRFPKLEKFRLKLKKILFYGTIIVILLESYLEILIAALVQIRVLSWGSIGE